MVMVGLVLITITAIIATVGRIDKSVPRSEGGARQGVEGALIRRRQAHRCTKQAPDGISQRIAAKTGATGQYEKVEGDGHAHTANEEGDCPLPGANIVCGTGCRTAGTDTTEPTAARIVLHGIVLGNGREY